MNRKMKEALKEAYEAPAPTRKHDFLRNVPPQRVSIFSFMLSQAGYIRKRTLIFSLLVFVLSLTGACFLELDMLWIISAFMPFIALSAVTENSRSMVYGMVELEMSSRFSLRSVVLARMGILGVLHMLLLCLLVPLAYAHSMFTFLQVGMYILIPYLLTDTVGLRITRSIRGREGLYACVGVAVCVSVSHSLISPRLINVLYMDHFEWMIAVLMLLIIFCIQELKKMVRQTEELRWNLS